uniref:Mobile element protein n=1 Tax=Klebsiella pneumoniae TaxID=573 RepID=A0A8B0SV48_KLEPN|nr:Mobile element protein [Klebsiella pneumoniae]
MLVQCAEGIHTKKLEHQSGKLADWVRELLCRKKQLCRHLCSGKQAGQNSTGTDGATANLRSIKAEIHQFKQSFIWFLRILILMILTAHRPVEEPVKRKGSLKPYIFLEVHQARNSSRRGNKNPIQTPDRFKQANLSSKSVLQKNRE